MKKLLSIIAITALFCVGNGLAAQATWSYHFSDFNDQNPHHDSIYYLAEKGIIKGYTVTEYGETYQEFRPNKHVTNAHVARMLVRALKLENERYVDPGFKDVPKSHDAYKEIAIATSYGFFEKGGLFKPNEPMTRERVALTLTKGFNLTGKSTLQFKDVPETSAYYDAIQALASNNITIGDNGNFSPKKNVTRGQFASFLTRTILPETRPTNDVYDQNSGLLPTNYGSTYVYHEFFEGDEIPYVLDSVYDFSKDDSYKVTRVDGFTEFEEGESEYSLIEYYEDADKFSVLFKPAYGNERLSINFPIKANTSQTRTYYDYELQESITETTKVMTTNGIFKAGDTIYTDVIVIEVKKSTDYDPTTFYLAKDVGVLAVWPGSGYYELAKHY